MKKVPALVSLALTGLVLTGCGASESEQNSARQDVKDRGFTVTSVESAWPDLFVHVVFGKNCNARITYSTTPRDMKLHYEAPVPGSQTETTDVQVEDPRVDNMRTIPPFNTLCFS
jgi:hypothetical protein